MFLREDLMKIATGKEKLFHSIVENKRLNISNYIDAPNYIKFLVCLNLYGKDILEWEFETLEIVLSRDFLPYSFIEGVASVIYLANNHDYVLSSEEHFANAVNILNDKEIIMGVPEKTDASEIIWTAIVLAMLYSSNFKVIGSAAEYVVNSLKETGWTTLPAFIAQKELNEMFDYPNLDNYNYLQKYDFLEIDNLSSKDPSLNNYIIMHKPIIEYVVKKIKEYKKYI